MKLSIVNPEFERTTVADYGYGAVVTIKDVSLDPLLVAYGIRSGPYSDGGFSLVSLKDPQSTWSGHGIGSRRVDKYWGRLRVETE